MRNFTRSLFVAATLAAAVLAAAGPALAADGTWNGTTDALWATTTNWSASPVPDTGNIATFNNAGNGNVVIDLGVSGVTVKTILFDTASAAAYTIGAGTVGSQTLSLDDTGAVTMNATVANNQLFNAGIILGTAITGTYTFTNNSLTNTLTFAGDVQGGTGGTGAAKTLTVSGSGNSAISGIIGNGGSSALALTKSGVGTLTLSGVNSYTGLTTVSAGTLAYGITDAISTGSVTVNGASAVLAMGSYSDEVGLVTLTTGEITGSGTLTSTVGFTMNNAGTNTAIASPVLAGAGALTKTATGTLFLKGANTYTGATVINAGVLSVSSLASGGAASGIGQSTNAAANLTLGGGTLRYTGATQEIDRNFVLTAATTSTVDVTTVGTNLTISGASTATTGALTKSGAGTLTLSGVNSHTGATAVSDGTLLLDMTGTGSLSSSSGLTLVGGTFSVLGKTSGTTDLSMGALKFKDKGGIGKIVLNPNGGAGTTLTLASLADRYVGSSLLIDYFANGGTQAVVLTSDTNYPLKGAPTGVYMDYLVKDSAGVTGFATREAVTNKIIRYDDTTGDILTTTSNNASKNFSTFNSTWTAGTLSWTDVANRSVTSLTIDTTSSSGIATIDMGAATNTLNPLSSDSELAILFRGPNDATLTGGRIGPNSNYMRGLIIHQVGASTLTINSPIQTGWSTDLTKDGEGTLVLGGTFVSDAAGPGTGAVVINGGTVKPGVASVPGITGPFGRNPVILSDIAGATLDLNTYNTSFAGLGGGGLLGGNVNLRAQALTVGDNNGAGTYAGVISSTGSPTTSLTKIGTGVQTLTGASTYTGATVVNKGTLTLNGVAGALTGTSAVTVTGNATLIDGDITLANNNDKNNRINTAATLTLGGGPVENAWGGTFTLYKPSVGGTTSQSLASLTVAPGASTIQNLGTGGTATLILTDVSASVYARNAGGTVNFATGMTSFTNAPSSNTSAGTPANPGNDPILVGAFFNNADFVKAVAGTVAAVTAYDTQNDASLWGTEHDGNINTSAAISGTTATGAVSINSLKSASAGAVITIGTADTDSLDITSGMILSTNTLTIDGPGSLASGNGQDLVVNTSNTVTVNAPISIGVLTKTGSGTLSLTSSASSITGNIYPRAGTLDFNNTGSDAYSNLISGVGGISKSGADALTLSGPISIGGAFTVNGGTANLTGLASLGGIVTVKAGGTLQWSNAYNAPGTTTGAITVGSTTGTGPAIASISSSGALNTGAITVGGDSTGNGGSAAGHTLSISSGTVDLKGAYLWVGGNTAAGGGTGTLNVSGASTVVQSLTGNSHFDPGRGTNSIAYINQSGGTVKFQFSDWSNGGSVIAYQTGGTNVFRGLGQSGGGTSSYTILGGSLSGHLNLCGGPGGGSNSGDGANATLNVLGGTATATATMYMVGSTTTRTGMTATLNVAGGTATFGSGLNMSAAAASNNAVVNLSGGTLALSAMTVGASGTSTMNISGGTLKYTGNSTFWMQTLTNAYVFSGGANIDSQAFNGTIAQALKTAAGIGLTSINFNPLTDGGAGYTAAPVVTIDGGTLAPGGSAAQAVATWDQASGKVTGIVIVNPGQYAVGSPPTDVAFSNPVPGSSPNVWTTAATASIGTTASNSGGGLTKTGTGTLTLTAANTYNGDTVVSDGILALGHVNALQNSTLDTGVSSAARAVTLFAGNINNIGGLKGGDDIAIAASTTISVGANNASTAYTGILGTAATAGALTKVGSGTLTLSGANIYTGLTTVNDGKLLINSPGSLAGEVAVGSGGTLGGTGTIAGPVAVDGTLAPGASAGKLTVNNSVTMAAGSSYVWQLGNTEADTVDVNGSLAIASNWSIKLMNDGGTPSGLYDLFTYDSFPGTFTAPTIDPTGTWTSGIIVQEAATPSLPNGPGRIYLTLALPGDTNADNVVDAADYIALKTNFGMTEGATLAQGNFNADIDGDVDWDDLQILMANFGTRGIGGAPAAPEPATLGLLALGALAVIRRRRVRKA